MIKNSQLAKNIQAALSLWQSVALIFFHDWLSERTWWQLPDDPSKIQGLWPIKSTRRVRQAGLCSRTTAEIGSRRPIIEISGPFAPEAAMQARIRCFLLLMAVFVLVSVFLLPLFRSINSGGRYVQQGGSDGGKVIIRPQLFPTPHRYISKSITSIVSLGRGAESSVAQ